MREVTGNLWDFHGKGEWVAITTNGIVTRDGYCVMGRGVAREAATKFPGISRELGTQIRQHGNHVQILRSRRIIAFPVKHHWRERASLKLIERSATELSALSLDLGMGMRKLVDVYMVRPGCGNGQLQWDDVKGVIAPILADDRFVIVERQN